MPLAQFADPWQKLPVGHMENEVGYYVFDIEECYMKSRLIRCFVLRECQCSVLKCMD